MRKTYNNWPDYIKAQQSTRGCRRAKSVLIDGKAINAHKFLKSRAKDLPPVRDKKTGKPVNHERNLIRVFDGLGIGGVNKYIESCRAVTKRDTGTFLQRVSGWFIVLKLRLKRLIKR